MRASYSFPFLRQKGFSLIELMISLTLGGLIIAAVGTVYLGSRQSFRVQDGMARMQEGARYIFELMTVDLRQAGFTGCATSSKTYSVVNGTDWFNNLSSQPLVGYESGAGLPAAVTGALANTDAVAVLRADTNSNYRVDSHTGGSAAAFTLAANHDLKQGEILTVVPPDCSKAIVFQMTSVNNNNTVALVDHNTGQGSPGNSTKCLDDPVSSACNSGVNNFPALPQNSRILRMSGHIYYIANNDNTEPSLYRESLITQAGNATSAAEELVEGVENMQILYGEDTSQVSLATCPDDGCSVDTYVAANAVTNWNRVVSVRVTLTMRTPEDNLATEVDAAGDRRIRKTFTMTIAVRNRL
jgi:type IV pilus assembly protein PilW